MKTTGKTGYRNRQQKGISLFVVLIILLLTMLVALWASRTALFSEMVTANDADYQRALERAQALVADAKFDIARGACVPLPAGTSLSAGQVCRYNNYAGTNAYYPESETEFFDMYYSGLLDEDPSCRSGICLPGDNIPVFFWQDQSKIDGMQAQAATYGAFTGRMPGYLGATGTGSYWVEVLRFDKTRVISNPLIDGITPTPDRPFVFRITAVANGARSSTRAAVQSIFVWRTLDD